MGSILALCHLHPLAAPLFHRFGVLMGGHYFPPLFLLIIVGGLHSCPLLLLLIMGGLPSPPLLLGLWGTGGIVVSAAYFGELCFFGHSSLCHL
jgi:hypothetical protein